MCPAEKINSKAVEFFTVINKYCQNVQDFINTQKGTKNSSGTLTEQAERNILKKKEH